MFRPRDSGCLALFIIGASILRNDVDKKIRLGGAVGGNATFWRGLNELGRYVIDELGWPLVARGQEEKEEVLPALLDEARLIGHDLEVSIGMIRRSSPVARYPCLFPFP